MQTPCRLAPEVCDGVCVSKRENKRVFVCRRKDQCNGGFFTSCCLFVGLECQVKKLHVAVHQSAPTSPSPLGLATVEVICTVI